MPTQSYFVVLKPPERKIQSPLWPRLLAIAAVVLVILATARILTTKWRSDSERPVILPLKVSDQLGTLQIEWDRSFKQVLEADSGEILISDGPRVVTKNLDGAAVHQGGFQFVRGSEDVRIQLTLFRGGKPTAKEISVFVGPKIIRAKDAAPDRSGRQLQRFADENVRLRDALKKETARSQRLDRTVRQLQDRLANRK